MDSSILKTILAISQQQNDKFSKFVEMRLLSVSDLVAAEAMYLVCISHADPVLKTHPQVV